ncbi:VOC family protein [Actinoplanes sp. NPDC049548]|uniref:VOC family protein n=1 Tax=Actinoplanes sp. NPDC049548 TaxID=3155152 RepID=UPI00341EE673
MTCRIDTITIDALDPRPIAEFWAALLGWHIVTEDADIISIGPGGGARPMIDVVKVPERKSVKNRLHLDLRADGTTAEQEVARALALGGRRVDVGQPADVTWTVLADPEGNEFCILSRSVQGVAGS